MIDHNFLSYSMNSTSQHYLLWKLTKAFHKSVDMVNIENINHPGQIARLVTCVDTG